MDETSRGAEDAATVLPETRALAELLLERLKLGAGACRLELEGSDGRLVTPWRHERYSATQLDRFDTPFSGA